jgi:hypothetical protein
MLIIAVSASSKMLMEEIFGLFGKVYLICASELLLVPLVGITGLVMIVGDLLR